MAINFSFLDFIQAQMPNYYDELKIEPFIQVGKSGIKIKKKNRGKFTEYCGGTVTSACIARGKNSSDPAVRKRATFAANARAWKHQYGGTAQTKDVQQFLSQYKAGFDQPTQQTQRPVMEYSNDDDIVAPVFEEDSESQEQLDTSDRGFDLSELTYGGSQRHSNTNTNINIDAVYNYLSSNAQARSIKRCAEYVRKALEAGGFDTTGHPASAYMYKQFAPSIGFREVGRGVGNQLPQGYTPGNKLTMVVYDRTPEHPHGHVAFYNPKTKRWTSDFEQNNMNVWRDVQGNYSIFEYA